MAAILALWVPALVFAHLWAALFIWQLIKVARPQLARRLSVHSAWLAVRRAGIEWEPCRTSPNGEGGDQKPAAAAAAAAAAAEGKDTPAEVLQIAVPDDPVRPVSLSWSGLSCSYTTQEGSKTVLQDVSGSVAAGEMAALLGPSGSGKSTLMDMLAGRKSTGTLSGTVYINGRPRTKADQHNTTYVPQDILFVPSMTVEETCCYYAALTLPPGTSKQQRAARIASVLDEMGLSHSSGTLVGGMLPGGMLLRGLSGGERKRLAIATGLLAGPSLLFLDEPTSGLDSYAAWSVMCTLCDLAHDAGHTVVASVHQPRAAIWNLFDQVVLLSKGLLLYSGPRSDLVPWFQGLGYAYDADAHGLPCDWVMDLVNVDFESKSKSTSGSRAAARRSSSITNQQGTLAALSNQQGLEHAAQLFKKRVLGAPKGAPELLSSRPRVVPPAAIATLSCSSQAGSDIVPGGGAGLGFLGALESPSRTISNRAAHASDITHVTWAQGAGDTFPSGTSLTRAGDAIDPFPSSTTFWTVADVSDTTPSRSSVNLKASVTDTAITTEQGVTGELSCYSSSSGRGSVESATRSAWATRTHAGWWQQMSMLMWRESLSIARNPADAAGRVLVLAYVAFAFGGLYYSLGTSLDALRMRLNLMYLLTMVLLLKPYTNMSLYMADKQYFVAETSAGLISPSAYYVAKQLLLLPVQLVGVAVVTCIYYGMAGLRRSASALLVNFAVNSLVHLVACQVLAAAAIITTTQDAAFMVSVVWSTFNLMLGNFLVRYQDMTWQWMAGLRWLVVSGFALDILETTELEGIEYPCTAGSLDGGPVSLLDRLFPRSTIFKGGLIKQYFLKNLDNCVLDAGALAEYYQGFPSIQLCFGYLVGYLVLVHAISYLGLLRAAKREAR